MSSQAQSGPPSKWELTRVIARSVVRTLLCLLAILWALWLVPETPDYTLWRPIAIIVGGAALYIFFFRRQLRRIEHSRFPTVTAFEGLIIVAVMFLAFFATIYVMMSAGDPASFTEPLDHFTAFYFALTVLATVGFGDITPVLGAARLACMIQMAIDIVLIAVLVRAVTSAAQRSAAYRKGLAAGKSDSMVRDL